MSADAMKIERCRCGAPVVYARSASGKRGTLLDAEAGGGHEDTWVDPATGEITVSHMRIPSPSGRTVHVCPRVEQAPTTALPFDQEAPPVPDDTAVEVVCAALVAAVAMYVRPVTVFEVRSHMAGYPTGPGITATRQTLEYLARVGRCRAVVRDDSTVATWDVVAQGVAPS